MANLMNVNNMAMGPGVDANEGSVPRTYYKHVGELADESKAKVVVVYRVVPGEPNNCLVIGTKFLSDMYHNGLMKAVESEGGQAAEELGPFLARQTFPDGTNMLAILHNDNYIKKFKTKDIVMTYGPTAEGRITLNKLNDMIAKEKGVKVSDLAVQEESPATEAPAKKTTKKTDAKETTTKE